MLIQRRERDSNPRYVAVQWFSRPPHSTTLPSLQYLFCSGYVNKPETHLLSNSYKNILKIERFQSDCGESRIRTYEDESQRSYSPPQLATLVSPQYFQHKKRISIEILCAEREGFEPPVRCRTMVFKTTAFDHSAISPILVLSFCCSVISCDNGCKCMTKFICYQTFFCNKFELFSKRLMFS